MFLELFVGDIAGVACLEDCAELNGDVKLLLIGVLLIELASLPE
jgi:hypothetical protein